MPKKVYRSLFDNNDVYEVEELTDKPAVSTEGVAGVKKDDAEEVTMKQLLDALNEIKGLLTEKKVGDAEKVAGVGEGNAPAVEANVTKVNPVIDEAAESKEAEEKSKEKDEKGAEKEVKDAYSQFSVVSGVKKEDPSVSTQVAFQKRYNNVANK